MKRMENQRGRRLSRRTLLTMLMTAIAAMVAVAACGGSSSSPTPSPTATAAAQPTSAATPTTLRASSNEKIKICFFALTDATSVIIAKEKGYFDKYGLNVDVVKQASWASTRDALLNGDIQAAHMLFGMPFSVYTGVGGPAGKEIHIAMMLNNNGQATTLSKDEFGGKVKYADLASFKTAVEDLKKKKEVTFAMTFPGGTHDMWLRYQLAAAGVDQNTVKIITIPPPQMVANMKVGNMDGFNVGEPWVGVAVKDGVGFTWMATQDMWLNHPEKALGVNKEFAEKRRDDLKLVMRAILEASQYIEQPENIAEVAKIVGQVNYINASADVIDARLSGQYDLGADLGKKVFTDDSMRFYRGGDVNYPRKGYAVWYMAQYVRFNYLKELPDAKAIADKLIMQDLYEEVAKGMGIPLPKDDMQPFTIKLDNARFDPKDPMAYLKSVGGGK